MAFIKKLDDKVAKWQSSFACKLLIYRHFVNFATLPPQNILSIGSDSIRYPHFAFFSHICENLPLLK